MEPTKELTQKVNTATYVRFKVTTCLYLSPNNRARSLFTIMALSVDTDTTPNIRPVARDATDGMTQMSHSSFTAEIQRTTTRGCTVIPTQRSVVARLRNKSLDGG